MNRMHTTLTAAVFIGGLIGASSIFATGYNDYGYRYKRLSTSAIPCKNQLALFHCSNSSRSRSLYVEDVACFSNLGDELTPIPGPNVPDLSTRIEIPETKTLVVQYKCLSTLDPLFCKVRVSSLRNAACAVTTIIPEDQDPDISTGPVLRAEALPL